MTDWAQHGSYSLSWQGDVLLARYGGTWNEIASRNLHQEARELWAQRGLQSDGRAKPWGLLSDALDWEGGTPEALDLWWKFFEDGVRHGMVAVTDVLPTQFHEAMVKALADRAGQLARYQLSASVDEGLAWLAEQGLQSNSDAAE
ncbi:hypothetical protein WG899_01360 [Paucibacter sp. AS339]|uniref:hypothetical protein n=1 Tax=Paucibacter hankyongi TaxID=3133434 RepID=UPI0030B3FA73